MKMGPSDRLASYWSDGDMDIYKTASLRPDAVHAVSYRYTMCRKAEDIH